MATLSLFKDLLDKLDQITKKKPNETHSYETKKEK